MLFICVFTYAVTWNHTMAAFRDITAVKNKQTNKQKALTALYSARKKKTTKKKDKKNLLGTQQPSEIVYLSYLLE